MRPGREPSQLGGADAAPGHVEQIDMRQARGARDERQHGRAGHRIGPDMKRAVRRHGIGGSGAPRELGREPGQRRGGGDTIDLRGLEPVRLRSEDELLHAIAQRGAAARQRERGGEPAIRPPTRTPARPRGLVERQGDPRRLERGAETRACPGQLV